MRIAVAGGTGVVGSHVVRIARERGHDVRILARSTAVDLVTGAGVAAALAGVDAVIDVTSTSASRSDDACRFFGAVTGALLGASVPHLVTLSIIGAAAIDDGYYAGKAEQERMLEREDGGWTLLRATQFHEFAEQLLPRGRVGPLQIVPTMRSQPIAAAEAAAELVALAEGPPRGLVPDLAGPREERMRDLVRKVLRHRGSRRPVLEVPLPGAFGEGLRDGTVLPGPGARHGNITFAEWLATRPRDPSS